MTKKRTPMKKIKEVLRFKYQCGLSYRSIASCLNVSLATVSELVARFKQSQIGCLYQKVAGDKLFIDYCRPRLQMVNPETDEEREAEVFEAALGASNYTDVDTFPIQGKSYWLEAHANALEHFGGVPQLLVLDNLCSAVSKANRYEPRLNGSYQQLANHYQTTVMPARPYKPKDKAENAVLLVERWSIMRLRHQTFHILKERNLTIRELMNDLNQREMKQYGASRKALFDKLDKPALKLLPKQ